MLCTEVSFTKAEVDNLEYLKQEHGAMISGQIKTLNIKRKIFYFLFFLKGPSQSSHLCFGCSVWNRRPSVSFFFLYFLTDLMAALLLQ